MKALVLIDVQNDFIDGSLGSEWAQRTVPKIAEFIKAHPEYKVFATRDTHFTEDSEELKNTMDKDIIKPYKETLECEKLPVLHCVDGTKGWELHDLVKGLVPSENVVDKPTFMSYHPCYRENGREDWNICTAIYWPSSAGINLDKIDWDEILICGFVTSICVVANALLLRAAAPNLKISVIEDLCADVSEENHKAALTVMQANQIDVIKSNEI